MKPPKEEYDAIPKMPRTGVVFAHIPGVYCKGCGRTFALYSYSMCPPAGIDEEGKPFYTSCMDCPVEEIKNGFMALEVSHMGNTYEPIGPIYPSKEKAVSFIKRLKTGETLKHRKFAIAEVKILEEC